MDFVVVGKFYKSETSINRKVITQITTESLHFPPTICHCSSKNQNTSKSSNTTSTNTPTASTSQVSRYIFPLPRLSSPISPPSASTTTYSSTISITTIPTCKINPNYTSFTCLLTTVWHSLTSWSPKKITPKRMLNSCSHSKCLIRAPMALSTLSICCP